jgi:hypothetical protein
MQGMRTENCVISYMKMPSRLGTQALALLIAEAEAERKRTVLDWLL